VRIRLAAIIDGASDRATFLLLSPQHSSMRSWRRGWEFEVVLAGASRTPAEGASPLARSP